MRNIPGWESWKRHSSLAFHPCLMYIVSQYPCCVKHPVQVHTSEALLRRGRHGTHHHDGHRCRIFPMSTESLSLVVQPRQRGTPRVRPDSRTATVCESGEICQPPEANTRGCATLLVGA